VIEEVQLAMTPRETGLEILATHHIALSTTHFARLRDFYTETLGLSILGGFPEHHILFLDAGTTAIELIEETEAETRASAGGWAHIALEVADVDATYVVLSARGVPFHIPPEDFPPDAPAVRIAFCKDPEGNVIELLQPFGRRYPNAVRDVP
jgi:glyoxylase I family protein